MRIFIQFSLLFTEILLAAVELAAGALILREFWRRRNQLHLLFIAISLLVMGVGNLFAFASDFFIAHGGASLGEAMITIYSYVILFGSLLFAYGFVNLYAVRKKLWYALATIGALVVTATTNAATMTAFGQLIPASTVDQFLSSYGYWMIVHLITLIVATSAYAKSRRNNDARGEADHMLLIGSGLSLLSGITAVSLVSIKATSFSSLPFLIVIFGTAYKYIGAVAAKHPDEKVQVEPGRVITGSITVKVLLACGMFYVLFAFALVSSITQYFVQNTMEQQHQYIQQTVHVAAKHHDERKQMLLAVSDMLASNEESLAVLNGDKSAVDRFPMQVITSKGLEVNLVDDSGSVLLSSYERSNTEDSLSGISVVENALAGESSSMTSRLWAFGAWSVVAASPVVDSSGQSRGAIVVSQPIVNDSFPSCLSNQKLSVSGCGMVSSGGDEIYSVGNKVDAVTLSKFASSIRPGSDVGGGDIHNLGSYFTGADANGVEKGKDFYYAYISEEDRDENMLRIMSMVVLITISFFMLFSFVLVFGMNIFLRPVLMLRYAALRLTQGDYDQKIEYLSPDEIGQLAQSFNEMTSMIRERTRRLDEKVREQRDALSHTALEMRIPLNIFRWSLEMLRFGDVGVLNNEQMELVEQMNQTNDRIRKLVNELLDVSNLEQGSLKLELVEQKLEDLIEEIAGSFSVRFREKKIDFYWRRPEPPLPLVSIDHERITQVVTNLVSNAVKFTPDEGHIEIYAKEQDVSGPSGREGKFVCVTVRDNGQGIPQQEQKNIFRKFYRATNVVEAEIEGTGLGMYLAKQYVEMHGGEIWFESKESEGTSVHFTIPIKK